MSPMQQLKRPVREHPSFVPLARPFSEHIKKSPKHSIKKDHMAHPSMSLFHNSKTPHTKTKSPHKHVQHHKTKSPHKYEQHHKTKSHHKHEQRHIKKSPHKHKQYHKTKSLHK